DILGIFLFARHEQRQLLGSALNLDGPCENLDLTGRQVRIDGAVAASFHFSVDRDNAFQAQPIQYIQRRTILIGYNLGNSVMVAKVDKQHAAMVALAMNPARKANSFA